MTSQVDEIIEALGPREVLAQAVEVLQARHGISHDEALDLLVRGSSRSHAKVREIAARVVRRAIRRQARRPATPAVPTTRARANGRLS